MTGVRDFDDIAGVTPDDFAALLESLTGTPVKDLSDVDKGHLKSVLADESRELGCSQLNELLLLANKDRVERPFFEHYFCTNGSVTCRVGDLSKGVDRFRISAMVRFGNFIYAYRRLSRVPTGDALVADLGDCAVRPENRKKKIKSRHSQTLTPELIAKEDTHYVGYLTAVQAAFDVKRIELLRSAVAEADWASAKVKLEAISDDAFRGEMVRILERLQAKEPEKSKAVTLVEQAFTAIQPIGDRVRRIQAQAKRNSDIYLTWDYMDVYFATSMRKRSEYEDLFDFVEGLLARDELKELKPHLRWFDPTQSFEGSRIDKGLIEALMLKRASCTVYSVQDVDTLGKDSELAATLAQGKPVIAYAPRIDVAAETARLTKERPGTLRRRLNFVVEADEDLLDRLDGPTRERVMAFARKLEEFEASLPIACKTWLPGGVLESFQKANQEELKTYCGTIAGSLARIYDKRASTLLSTHPLGLQVNLDTGVANGVLVARDLGTCARLLRGVLLNSLDLYIADEQNACWVLKERETSSVYRVVTKNRKLTNCFWNFYR